MFEKIVVLEPILMTDEGKEELKSVDPSEVTIIASGNKGKIKEAPLNLRGAFGLHTFQCINEVYHMVVFASFECINKLRIKLGIFIEECRSKEAYSTSDTRVHFDIHHSGAGHKAICVKS